jgi:ABC-type Fe3+-siderophore transport system permease subunit
MDLNASTVSGRPRCIIYLLLAILLAAGMLASLSVGAVSVRLLPFLQWWIEGKETKELMIVQSIRLPRAVIGAIVGMNLALSGAIMQAVTRNPLASPQVFGINAGASLAVVASLVLIPGIGTHGIVYFAFIGAVAGGLLVYSIASSGGMTPVKIALAGMTVHFLLSSMTQGLIIFDEKISDVLYWLTGAIDGSSWKDIGVITPWSLTGLVLCAILYRPLTLLNIGEDVAKGLGQKVERTRLLAAAAVIVLAGSSVAVAGPVGFVGLIVPNIVKIIAGNDYRAVLPLSALGGAVLMTYADVLARFIAFPYESPVGIVTAMLGAPFFLYLAKKGMKR